MSSFKKAFLLIGLITLFSTACEDIVQSLTFTIDNQTTFTIENQIPVDQPYSIPTPDITSNASSTFESHNTGANLVESIYLDELQLSIVSPEGFTFSFMKSVKIYISATDLEEVQIATKDNIDPEATSIDMETSQQNIKPYIISDTYDLRFEVVTREAFSNDVTLRVDMKYKATAEPK